MTIDEGAESYVTDQCGFNPEDATDMTDTEIRAYFTAENFTEMFSGEADADDTQPYTFEELANVAIDLRNRAQQAA